MIGSGGREHALALALAADPAVGALHIAPGNAGTAEVGTNHPVDATDPADVVRLARELAVDLVVIGPEAPLVAGVADALREAGFATFGPSGAAAQIEGSKAFAKQVMAEAGVPTAMAHVCTTLDGGRPRARPVRRAPRGQGRRPGRREGRGRHRRPAGRPRPRRRVPVPPRRRRRGGGVPRRPGGLAVRDHRRVHRRAAGPRAGLQAGRRRRRRPEHRGHGRLRTAALGTRRARRRDHDAGRPADDRPDGRARHAVQRPAVRGPGPDLARAARRRVQRPVR